MRNNQPVTQEEYVLREGAAIVSRTTPQGAITFCNEEFVEASGFEREELIGKAHNIVRHPDVPPEAFRDLWDTVQRGRPWVGIVKNRRKNGGFYWVRASVTPLPNGDGYSSVRTKPTREEIAGAEALYKRMWNDSTIRLHEGAVVGNSAIDRLRRMIGRISVAAQLWMMGGLSLLLLLASFLIGANALLADNVSLTQAFAAAIADPRFDGLIAVLLTSVLITLTMTWLITRRISRSLESAQDTAKAIASGDLTRPLPTAGQDEFGHLLCKMAIMRNSLHELIATVRQNVDMLNLSASELSLSAASSAQASDSQSDAASSMAASVEELSVSVDMVEENAKQAYSATQVSSQRSEEGARIIHQAADEMVHIADSVNATAATIRELGQYSEQISTIASVIKDIADQTNLLALNAAIEAARAGEQGRGFAVVADEVRKLAERTANSTEEISGMIVKIQTGTQRAATEMEAGVSRVDDGVRLARQAGDSMQGIREDARLVMHAVEEITGALQEQVMAAREIAQRVESIAQLSESNSAAAGQTASSAQQVEQLAHHLHDVTTVFRIS